MKTSIVAAMLAVAPLAAPAQQAKVIGGESPSVSPDGRRIAFLSDRFGITQVFVIDVDGTNERLITHSPEAKGPATWKSDGRTLTFTVFANDTTRLFDVDVAGGGPRQVGVVPGRMATLSADRKRVVYSMGSWTANKLITADLDGGNGRQITDSASTRWNMKWSPNGRQIAFTGQDENGTGLAVFIMNADGSGRRQVTRLPTGTGGAQVPAWSPDGRRLAFQVTNKTNNGGVWIVDLAGGTARELGAHAPGYIDESPAWFPDGKQVAFQSNRSGRMEIWVVDADGSGVRQVTGKR